MKLLLAAVPVLLLPSAGAGPATALCSGITQSYVIEIQSEPDSTPTDFEAAIGANGTLRIIRGETPYRTELRAPKFVAMFVSGTDGVKLAVEMFGREKDGLERLGSIIDLAPLILENASCPEVARAFGRV